MDVQDFELSAEQRAFRHDLRRFVDAEIKSLDFNDYEWREDPLDRVPWHVVERGDEELNLTALGVPEEYGGEDASPLTMVMATEELSVGDTGIGHIFSHTWKHTNTIARAASDALRDEFFPRFMDDPVHPLAVTISEPAHGSDNSLDGLDYQLETVAEKDGDEWVINGRKRFITNGAEAKTYVVFAQTDPDVPAPEGTTAFLVPHEYDGIDVELLHEKISSRLYNNATIEYTDLRVPEARVLGEVNRGFHLGEGTQRFHGTLETSGMALGIGRRAFEDAFAFAHERVQGGTEIINHQAIGHDFADMAIDLQSARALLWTAARAIEHDAYTEDLGAKAKVHTAEVAFDVAKRSLEKFGGSGVMLEHPTQKYLRDTAQYFHAGCGQEVLREKIVNSLRDRYAPAP